MTSARAFYQALPYALIISFACTLGVLAIFAAKGLCDAFTRTAVRIFPPDPPDNVFPIDDYRQHYRETVRRELIIADAFRRFNEIDQPIERVH